MRAPYKEYTTRWGKPDREWLFHEHLELGKPLKQIAGEVGVDQATVQRWAAILDIYNNLDRPYVVGARTSGMRIYGMTRKWLEHEYVTLDQSAKQIGGKLGCSHNAIVNALRQFGFKLRDRDEMNARHSKRMSGNGNPAWKGGTAQNYQVRTMRMSDIVQQCTWCGRTDGVQVHHIDHDTSNGAPENLIWLCHNCNVVEANLWNLEQKGFAAHEYDPDGHILTIRFGDNRALSGAEGHRGAG